MFRLTSRACLCAHNIHSTVTSNITVHYSSVDIVLVVHDCRCDWSVLCRGTTILSYFAQRDRYAFLIFTVCMRACVRWSVGSARTPRWARLRARARARCRRGTPVWPSIPRPLTTQHQPQSTQSYTNPTLSGNERERESETDAN